MKKIYYSLLLSFLVLTAYQSSSQIVISAMMPNPTGTDSACEYIQLMATEHIDFAATPYSVVLLNNGSATVKGWANGLSITYKYNLTSGVVNTGEVFYVGGDRKKIDGPNSTDLSSMTWIRAINNVTTAGDGFGNASVSGVFGNAGNNADGAGVFSGTTIDSTSVPIDALFYGTAIGTAYIVGPPEKGYQVPSNDHYNHAQGLFGAGANTYFASCTTLQDTLLSFTGTYDTVLNSWTISRTPTKIKLTVTSAISEINTNITLTGTLVGVSSNDIANNISIYPNPSNGMFNITNLSGRTTNVEVFDMLGNSVYKTISSDNDLTVNMTKAAKGIYFIELSGTEGKKVVKKMIIK
ncbi:MAG TPA: T9SS type A sorting domain-containing protein [Bacteroidales bacterium]|nr:T9SS type A sorting domain-containing protein [Bacteroidales bacterium]